MRNVTSPYHFRWLIVTTEGIGYFKKNTLTQGKFHNYVSYTRSFDLTLESSLKMTLRLDEMFLYFKFRNEFGYLDFTYAIVDAFMKSSATNKNPFDSFCKTYTDNDVKFYINGGSLVDYYFADLHAAIEEAKQTICITDWFLSPEIYLKRPKEDFPDARLDLTLKRACERGVEVFMILYQGINGITYHKTERVKQYLHSLHPNFYIARHPGDLIRHRCQLLESSREDCNDRFQISVSRRN